MNNYTEPNFKSSAVITIDTQCDTLDGEPFEIPGTTAVLPQMKAILDIYRSKQLPIIHIVRIYKQDGSNADLCRRELIENGTQVLVEGGSGCELAPALFENHVGLDTTFLLSGGIQQIGANEVVIYKPRWGAFYGTPLEQYLKRLAVDTLVFTGCNFPNCPRTSIYEASERDYKLVLVRDAISGLYAQAEEEMSHIGVRIMAADAVASSVLV